LAKELKYIYGMGGRADIQTMIGRWHWLDWQLNWQLDWHILA
jgi:hypothetical protein